jgi:hypothetical protein
MKISDDEVIERTWLAYPFSFGKRAHPKAFHMIAIFASITEDHTGATIMFIAKFT